MVAKCLQRKVAQGSVSYQVLLGTSPSIVVSYYFILNSKRWHICKILNCFYRVLCFFTHVCVRVVYLNNWVLLARVSPSPGSSGGVELGVE